MCKVPISRFFHIRAPLVAPTERVSVALVTIAPIVIAVLALPLLGQTGVSPALAANQRGVVQKVVAREVGGAIEVEIQTSGGIVSPDTQAIAGPDRIVVDFPGAVPSAVLRALKVNHGALKGVRSGLFFSDPPITRIVLDLTGPQAYKISTSDHATVVRLESAGGDRADASAPVASVLHSEHQRGDARGLSPACEQSGDRQVEHQGARLQDAALTGRPSVAAHMSPASVSVSVPIGQPSIGAAAQLRAPQEAAAPVDVPTVVPAPPAVVVTYENGMLRIHADKATLAQVLYEVHLRTQAEIAIPAGAELEKVAADLGPAPARDVLGELLNGSAYNFIFVGDELSLQRVILTRREGNF
jgi:AMIN domain